MPATPRHSRSKTSKSAVLPTPEALHSLFTSIHPKTLHAYVLKNIPTAPPDTLATFASFFATLSPPPLLHCIRCHDDYRDVENGDRSCRIPHNDYLIDVEWIGPIGRYSEYETHYGCCGKVIEGEGDEPAGWCYRGMHTVSPSTISPRLFPEVRNHIRIYLYLLNFCAAQQTDVRRVEFPEDVTSSDDSDSDSEACRQLKCRKIRAQRRATKAGAGTRTSGLAKRPRSPADEAEGYDNDDGIDSTEDSSIVEIVPSVGALNPKNKGKGKARASATPKAGGVKAPAVVAVVPASRRRRLANAEPPGAASPVPGKALPSAKQPSVPRMDSVEVAMTQLRSRVPPRRLTRAVARRPTPRRRAS